jgi:ubiquitin-conjugating enzyme E2 variant
VAAHLAPKRPSWQVATEAAGLVVAPILLVALATRAIPDNAGALGFVLLAFGTAAGIVVADLLSGLAHWACDTFLEEDTPLVGPMLIAPFREHHRDPQAIVRHGFLERNGNNCLAVSAIAVAALVTGVSGPFVGGTAFGACTALALTNQIHCWAHAPHAPRLVAWMQRRRIVLSPRTHAVHHRGDRRRAYSITTGWTNALLDRSGVLRLAERLFSRRPRDRA